MICFSKSKQYNFMRKFLLHRDEALSLRCRTFMSDDYMYIIAVKVKLRFN